MFERVKIVLVPTNKPVEKTVAEKPASGSGTNTNLLTIAQFGEEMKSFELVYVLLGKEVAEESPIPDAVTPLVAEYEDVFLIGLPDGLPPLRDIQHHID